MVTVGVPAFRKNPITRCREFPAPKFRGCSVELFPLGWQGALRNFLFQGEQGVPGERCDDRGRVRSRPFRFLVGAGGPNGERLELLKTAFGVGFLDEGVGAIEKSLGLALFGAS